VIDLKDLNPVPRDLSTGWSASAEGTATRARAEWDSRTEERRRPRRMWAAAVAATVVLALVVSVVVLQSGSQQSAPPASRSVVERLAHGRWTALPPLPRGQDVEAMIWTGRELIVWGADRGVEVVGGVWRPLPDWSFGNRSGAIVRWTGKEMIVWGGSDPRLDYTPPADGAAYNPRTRTWRRIATAPFFPQGPGMTATWTGQVLVVTNGTQMGPPAASYDPSTDQWRVLQSGRGASGVRAAWDGNRVVFTAPASGFDASSGYLTYAYDPALGAWSRLPTASLHWDDDATALFREGRSVVQAGWYADPHGGFLAAAKFRTRWELVPNLFRRSRVCKAKATVVAGGAVLACGDRDPIGFNASTHRWSRLPAAPGDLVDPVWAGNSLVAVTNDGRIVRLSLGARSI
jgi:hypothetical protein